MANKKFGYDIKIDYNQATENTNRVTSSILNLQKAVDRLKNSSDINIKFTGVPRQLDNLTTKTATLANALERTAKSGNLASSSFDGMSAKMQSLKRDGEALAKGLQDSANAVKRLENANRSSLRDPNKALTTGTQISQLKNQADVLFQAWRNHNIDKDKYTQQMVAIQGKLNNLYGLQRRINGITEEHISMWKQWGFELDKVGSRLGYFATRWAALWIGDKIMDTLAALPKVEQDMAGFAQVMKHGSGETNAFAHSLLEVDPSHMVNSLQLSGIEAEHFKSELNEMQGELQNLAIRYGTTSHEMIESAKLWGRAYKDNNTVLALTDAATKLAVADAFDIVSANKALESSIMQWGFQIHNTNDAMSVSNRIIDSWTALAHNYTVSAQTLSEANKRMAQSAAEVGVSFHSAQALVAVMARKTQAEGGEIGNALKSIFGSIHSKKAIDELTKFGIQVYKIGNDGVREFRKVDDVLLDLMIKAQGSSQSMEGLLKAISGGKWQWNKADAMLDLKEYLTALRLSSSSMGFTNAQVGMQLDTIQTKIKQIAAQWEKMMTTNGNVSKTVKTALDLAMQLLQILNKIPTSTFVVLGGLIAVSGAMSRFGITSKGVQSSVSMGWNQLTAAVARYNVAVEATGSKAMGVKAAFAGAGGAVRKFGSAVQSATAFMGGWIGIILTLGTLLVDFAMNTESASDAIKKDIQSQNELLQKQEEYFGRLSESKDILSQYITAYDGLKEKLQEVGEQTESYKQVEDEMTDAKNGLIEILGQEKTEWILAGDTIEEQNQRAAQAVEEKKTEIRQQIEATRAAVIKSSQTLREMANEDIKSIQSEETPWKRRFEIVYKFLGLIAAVQDAWHRLMATMSEQSAMMVESKLADAQASRDDLQSQLDYAEENNQTARAFIIRKRLEWANQQVSDVSDELSQIHDSANYYNNEIQKTDAETIMAASKDALPDTGSGQQLPQIGDIGGGTTGDYPRSDVGDEDDDDGKKKGRGRTRKEKNPYSNTPEGEAVDFLIKQGFSANQAYGIVGNLMQESLMDPTITNDSGHFGLAQWGDDRRDQLYAFANANGSDVNNRATQLAFLVHELQTTEHDSWLQVLEHAKNGTPEEYAHYFDMFVERSGGGESAARQAFARQLANSGYGNETRTDAERASQLVERQNKIDELTKKLAKAEAEMENSMKPKEQADLAKESESLKEKIQGIQKEIDDLIKLNPKADVKKLQETMKKYDTVMTHRLQDKYRDKDYEKAEQAAKDAQENDSLDREIAGTAENFWTKDVRNAQHLVELYIIKVKQYQDMVAAFKRGDSEYTESDIRKAGIELKKLQVQIKKTGNELNKNIRQQTHDVFHSMIFEGKKFKDVWKDLWKQLAEDTLKMIFKIQDGNGGLLQNILRKKDKGYQKGIDPLKGLLGKGSNGNIGGVDENLQQQMMATQATQNLDKNFTTFMNNTQNGTAWNQATFNNAVIYGDVKDGTKSDLPEVDKDGKDGKADVSKYINAGMKLGGLQNNKWFGALGTVAGFARQFGLLKFASGGSVDKDQLVRVGEGDKKEYIIPTADKKRGLQLLNQAARDLGVGETHGITPNWKHSDTSQGALSEQTKRQDRLMNQMVANTSAMTKGMNYMANNGSTHESIAQPVFMKQTISDQDFLAKYNKLVALGKMK